MSDSIGINLGIDFGTRFTKVCAFSEEIGTTVVDFGGNGLDGMLTQSVIVLDKDGRPSVPSPGEQEISENRIAYLKMALADRGDLDVKTEPDRVPENSKYLEQALSAFFVAKVVVRSQKWIINAWKDEIGDRDVIWSANIGLPVEYSDSDVKARFQEAIAVGWDWAEADAPEGDVSEVVKAYAKCSARIEPDQSYCQAYPEIAAAILSFAASRDAVAGIYSYFDIGGGTVDGVVFKLIKTRGVAEIKFYSGHVDALGVDWVAENVCESIPHAKEKEITPERVKSLLFVDQNEKLESFFSDYKDKVTKLVAKIVYEGKQKDIRNWREANVRDYPERLTLRSIWNDENVEPLTIFIGGGGKSSPLYRTAVVNAYHANGGIKNFGIPPFSLEEVPVPADLRMQSADSNEYHRVLIACGLSIPFGQGPEITLPKQIEPTPRPKKQIPDVPDYLDQKDIFD